MNPETPKDSKPKATNAIIQKGHVLYSVDSKTKQVRRLTPKPPKKKERRRLKKLLASLNSGDVSKAPSED